MGGGIWSLDRASYNQGKNALYDFLVLENTSPTLTARGPALVCTKDASYYKGAGERSGLEREVVSVSHKVRKLTPKECERLQGFPDDWTATGIVDGEEIKISDTARYKACGNSVAIPCVEFVMSKIVEELSNDI